MFKMMDTSESKRTECEISGSSIKKYYCLQGVELTGRDIGQGSQSSVVEVRHKGLICAAKKYHLSNSSSNHNGNSAIDENEHRTWCYNLCLLLGQLRHPNVVQFLGFYREPETLVPVLVFEHLHISLVKCLDRYGTMPEDTAVSILKDVATALRYLHERSIPITLQQSLSASKVLLASDMTAKLTDVGVNCIAKIGSQILEADRTSPKQCHMSGKMVHFAPDIELKNDIYYFGLLMLHIFTGRNPVVELTEYYRLNHCSISEIDVVQSLLSELYEKHPLFNLIEQSLDITPLARPSIITLQQKISQVSSNYPPIFLNSLEMLQKIRTDKEQQLSMKNEIKKLSPQASEELMQSFEVERLRNLLCKVSAQNMSLRARLDAKITSEILLEADRYDIEIEGVPVDPVKKLRRQENRCISSPIEIRQGHVKWTKLSELPVGMFQAQGVYLRNKIYIGGGDTGDPNTDSLIFEYNYKTKSWSTLPPTASTYFGLCKLEGELISVGGKIGPLATSLVYVFDSFTKRWKDSLPCLSAARYSPSCISTQSAIIVAGGLLERDELLSSVEVLKSDTFQWYTAGYLPRSATLCNATAVALHDSVYLMGGYKSSTASSFSNSAHSSPVDILLNYCGMIPRSWSPLPPTPHYQSTAACIGPCLMSLGGTSSPYSPPVHQAMYGYCPSTETWVFVGDLPYGFCHGTAVSLPNNEIFIMGGWVQQGKHKRSCNVYHGSITR